MQDLPADLRSSSVPSLLQQTWEHCSAEIADQRLASNCGGPSAGPRKTGWLPGQHGTLAYGDVPPSVLIRDRLPHEFSDIDHEVRLGLTRIRRGSDLAFADTNNIVEALVVRVIARMENRTYDLATPRWVRPAIAVPFEHDRGAVFGLDDSTEVGPKRAGGAVAHREIGSSEPPAYPAFAPTIGDEEKLFPATFKLHKPTLRIGEPDSIEGLEAHSRRVALLGRR